MHKLLADTIESGSPPRVRSRRDITSAELCGTGITSACAEQTQTSAGRQPCWRDHLRVCGADGSSYWNLDTGEGSPPRVRSRLSASHQTRKHGWITSACAEQTFTAICSHSS